LTERQSGVRVIIVSAYGDMANLRTAMNRGAFDFVTKPVDLGDLEITVRKVLANIAKLREMDRLRQAAERARNNLARYFSPNIVELLAALDEPLGIVRRETVAVLFADIVWLTRMAEAMPPEAFLAMLREFYTRMTAQIFAFGGIVEKYIGDPILGVFGVPSASSKDAANALACAGKMIDALESWNEDRERAAEGRLAMGIGVNYGSAVLGDVGSEHLHVVRGDRRYCQHRRPIADADRQARDAAGRRRRAGRGGQSLVSRNRLGSHGTHGGSRRA